MLTGDLVDADRAYQAGPIDAVAAPEQVLSTAVAPAERISATAPGASAGPRVQLCEGL